MITVFVIPILIVLLLIYSHFKKVNSFKSFVNGAGEAIPSVVSLLPFLIAVFLMIEAVTVSGLATILANFISPVFSLVGIPKELSLLILLKPFSGSGSLAIISDIFTTYGPDDYISRSACVIMASSDTLFFILAVYFAKTKVKNFWLVIPISLIVSLLSAIMSCLICRVL